MKINLLILSALLIQLSASAQDNVIRDIAAASPPQTAIAPLQYLASDQLMGRGIDGPGINMAAQYIADQFKQAGAKTLSGADGYFQPFKQKFVKPSFTGRVIVGEVKFRLGVDALQSTAEDVNVSGPVLYVAHVADTARLTAPALKGRIIVVDILPGSNGSADFANVSRLVKYAGKRGAIAAIERYKAKEVTWHFMRSGTITNHPADALPARQFPEIIVSDSPALQNVITAVAEVNATIEISGTKVTEIALKNVLAYIKGTDPALSKQFIVLSSHYDHLGVAPGAVMDEGKMDSIYNGARDNATGTTAVIAAARYFSKHPPKRSVLFATYTAEEEGLIGSAYYAEHPLVPLAQTIYNLNIDNASYNDTTVVTLVGLKRTSADPLIIKALKAYGLTINNDPTGGSLFSESDNLPLAEKGIPAPTYSLGMTALDGTIFNRYHQLSDESGNMDMSYVLKFMRSFILSAKYIADDPNQPTWTKNDEFEKVWQQLFKATGK